MPNNGMIIVQSCCAVKTTTSRPPQKPSDHGGGDTAVDVRLFKVIGLHRILHGGDGGSDGPFRRSCYALLCVAFSVHAVQIAWLPSAAHDFQRLTYTVVMLTYGLLTSLKGIVVLKNASRLRAVLDMARLTFARCGRRHPDPMLRCRGTLTRLLRAAVVVCYGTFVFWSAIPWFVRDRVAVSRADGTVAHYRATVNNIWYPMSEATHNSLAGWAVLYSVEVLVGSVDVAGWMLFDCYLIAMCFVLDAQFRTLAVGYATLGHGPRHSSADIQLPNHDKQLQSDDVQFDHYYDLISHIKDNQNVIRKFDDFFDVVRPLIMLQIVISSFSVTIFTLYISLMIYLGQQIISVTFFKFVAGLILLITELYVCCYVFNLIESAKSTLNFGLYSCNWTGMDLKFKKTMLIAMTMNSSHKRVMKVSPNHIIHLEMFTEVLRMSLSMVSVLLNLTK